jgi:hypothetical protein
MLTIWLVVGFVATVACATRQHASVDGQDRVTSSSQAVLPGGDPPRCPPIATVDSTGAPLEQAWLDQVRAIHDAACRYDYDALKREMDPLFYSDYSQSPDDAWSSEAVISTWRKNDPEGIVLDLLAETLQTKGQLDQGGLDYRHDGAIVVLPRGTHDHPFGWSIFLTKCKYSPFAETLNC